MGTTVYQRPSKNRRSAERNAEQEDSRKAACGRTGTQDDLEPLDYMLEVMRDPTADQARRDMMAKAAAPYRHPQLQAVAHKYLNADVSPIGPKVTVTIMQPPEPKPQ